MLLGWSFSDSWFREGLASLDLVGEEVLMSREARGLVGEGRGDDIVVVGWGGSDMEGRTGELPTQECI